MSSSPRAGANGTGNSLPQDNQQQLQQQKPQQQQQRSDGDCDTEERRVFTDTEDDSSKKPPAEQPSAKKAKLSWEQVVAKYPYMQTTTNVLTHFGGELNRFKIKTLEDHVDSLHPDMVGKPIGIGDYLLGILNSLTIAYWHRLEETSTYSLQDFNNKSSLKSLISKGYKEWVTSANPEDRERLLLRIIDQHKGYQLFRLTVVDQTEGTPHPENANFTGQLVVTGPLEKDTPAYYAAVKEVMEAHHDMITKSILFAHVRANLGKS